MVARYTVGSPNGVLKAIFGRVAVALRILIIFSWDDDISQRRYERMKREKRLARYEFEQRFASGSRVNRAYRLAAIE